jgi:hypothetical protein
MSNNLFKEVKNLFLFSVYFIYLVLVDRPELFRRQRSVSDQIGSNREEITLHMFSYVQTS